jgi:hypothetical protein
MLPSKNTYFRIITIPSVHMYEACVQILTTGCHITRLGSAAELVLPVVSMKVILETSLK